MTIQTTEHSTRERPEEAKIVRSGALFKIQHSNGTEEPVIEHIFISPPDFIVQTLSHEQSFRSAKQVSYPRLPQSDEIKGLPLTPDFIVSSVSDYGKGLLTHEAGEEVIIKNEDEQVIAQVIILEVSFHSVTFTPKVPKPKGDLY